MKFLLTAYLFCFTSLANAVAIEIAPDKDNTLFETNLIGLSNGAGQYFFAGRTNQFETQLRRGLISFDLSLIPIGSTINQVSLEITASRTVAGERTIAIHNALQNWGESSSDANGEEGPGTEAEIGDATWTNAFLDGAAWLNVGGDFDPTALATANINGETTISFSSPELTNSVQSWLDTPATNFGWVILGDESEQRTAYRFNSRENSDSSTRPKLIIDYALPQTSLSPSKDNTLYETADGSTSNGIGDKIFFGKPNNGELRRGVLEFDVSGLSEFANITSVSLDLTVIDIPNNAQNGSAALHLALSEWGEGSSSGNGQGGPSQTGDATWIHTFYNSTVWNTAGGDFMPTASATSHFTDQTTVISFNSTAELIADVTTWIQDSQNNHGWILVGDENNNGNVRSVGSLDHGTAGNRPVLTVEYSLLVDLIFANGFEQP